MSDKDLNAVLKYIEENIRVTDQTTIEYIDPRGHISRLDSKQNQVIFGRRGSGKSLLLKSIKERNEEVLCFKTNLEDFKDISFPNSIIQVLKSFLSQLNDEIGKSRSWLALGRIKKSTLLKKEISSIIKKLDKQLKRPDTYEEAIRTKQGSKIDGKSEAKFMQNSASIGAELMEEVEVSKSIRFDKLNTLKNELTELKDLINRCSSFLEKPFFLILDDFYFVKRNDQPYFADFFHRLSKNTNLYLKIATIKHRSSLYLQNETYIGIELGHDAQALTLDYSLENFDALVQFTRDLLNHVKKKVNVSDDSKKLLTTNASKLLCLASGGVPRDFLSLFIRLGNKLIEGKKSITKPDVIEVAIENLSNKLEAFKTDSAEEKEILENYLQYIREEIVEKKRTNSFLVSNSDMVKYSQIDQAIKELIDLRLLHIVNSNTSSAPSDGKRYSAYMVDIGLYPNSRPTRFRQIEPGEKDEEGRKDRIRSAPKLNLEKFSKHIESLGLNKLLTETQY